MTVRPLEYGSAEYVAARELRRRFLREPIGLDLTAEDTAGEASQHHFGLFNEAGDLLGGVIGKADPEQAGVVRIRQMVVDEAHRDRGLGRRLLLAAEGLLADEGFTRSILFARPEAAAFYERCGYAYTGDRAELIGFTHHRMEKDLLAPPPDRGSLIAPSSR